MLVGGPVGLGARFSRRRPRVVPGPEAARRAARPGSGRRSGPRASVGDDPGGPLPLRGTPRRAPRGFTWHDHRPLAGKFHIVDAETTAAAAGDTVRRDHRRGGVVHDAEHGTASKLGRRTCPGLLFAALPRARRRTMPKLALLGSAGAALGPPDGGATASLASATLRHAPRLRLTGGKAAAGGRLAEGRAAGFQAVFPPVSPL